MEHFWEWKYILLLCLSVRYEFRLPYANLEDGHLLADGDFFFSEKIFQHPVWGLEVEVSTSRSCVEEAVWGTHYLPLNVHAYDSKCQSVIE